jgi:type IV pilus assembly protein PilO
MNSNLRKLIFFIVVIGVALIAYQYMIKPANENLAKAKNDLRKNLETLQKIEEQKAAAEDITEQLQQLQEAMEFFESKLPPTSEIDTVLKNVTVIAQKQGLQSKAIKTLKQKDNSGYIEQPLEMQLVGNFNSFYSFLLELEKLPRIMKVRQLKLDKKQQMEGEVTADIVVSIFFQNQNS